MEIEKWMSILDSLKEVDSDKREKMSLYADQLSRMITEKELIFHTSKVQPYIDHFNMPNLLVLNLKILKNLDNFTITNDPAVVENYEFNLDIEDGYNHENIESDVVNYISEKFKGKEIVIYSLVDSICVIDKGKQGFINISSRIKIK